MTPVRGHDTDESGYSASSHRRARRKAFRAAGRKLWDILSSES
jgi:hypothetical protein